MSYSEFLKLKTGLPKNLGFDPVVPMPKAMKRFQRDITVWACRRGRAAIFAGTGLGKTIQELAWATQIVAKTQGCVLIFAPLAVTNQIVAEADKFKIPDVSYAGDEERIKTSITVTNYDRLHLFDLSQFAGIALDESGIIKNYEGKIRVALTEGCRSVPYLLCASATPAPNDWAELGQHSEFLGVMTAKEMLATYFVHEGSNKADVGKEDWRLKRHAENEFWRWVASWAVMLRHPRDLGYDEDGYDLPSLKMHETFVKTETKQNGAFYSLPISGLGERIKARRDSIPQRIKAVVDIVNRKPKEPWLIWCGLNSEANAVTILIPGAVNVQGKDDQKDKIKNLLGFTKGNPRILVTKTGIAGRGMNWQHCSNMVFCGLNDSFEALFQALRRCWRFGQKKEVNAWLVVSDIEGPVLSNLRKKEKKYETMAEAMIGYMKINTNLKEVSAPSEIYEPRQTMEIPEWLRQK